MTINIPEWLLWTVGLGVGIPAVVVVLFLAYMGWVAITAVGNGIWR